MKSGDTVYEHTSSTHVSKKTITVPLKYHLKFDDVRKMQQQMINSKQDQLDINMSVPLSVSIADA